jgi:hypothetical protein
MYFAERDTRCAIIQAPLAKHGWVSAVRLPAWRRFYEVNPSDGRTYVVPSLSVRASWHCEHVGTQYEVLLGLLGSQLLAESGYYNHPVHPPRLDAGGITYWLALEFFDLAFAEDGFTEVICRRDASHRPKSHEYAVQYYRDNATVNT